MTVLMKHTFIAVMSMTCHRMRGRCRRFLRIMSRTTDATKSMFVMSCSPSLYLTWKGFVLKCQGKPLPDAAKAWCGLMPFEAERRTKACSVRAIS